MGLFAMKDDEFYKKHSMKTKGRLAFDGKCRKCGKETTGYLFLCKECLKNANFAKRVNLPTRRPAKEKAQNEI